MIPLKLELTNFLSYRQTAVIDFADIHLACVAGANGAGKSSIMDGITWALFGQSRSRSDDDLINRYAARSDEAAEVRFTFALEGVTYRIVRRKRVGKTTVLELQMAAGVANWRPLSESKLRETQAAIEQLLRMNYDTFINASFLLQGKADEFTTRTDSQRKQILAELLGATQWEGYRATAAEARRQAEGQEMLIDGRLQEILSELAEEDSRQEALVAARAARETIAEKLALREQLLQQTRQTAAVLEQLRRSAAGQGAAVRRAEQNLAQLQQTLATRRRERDQWDAVVAAKESILEAFAAWQAADTVVQTQQELANQTNRLNAKMKPLELAIGQQQSRLEAQINSLRERARQAAQAGEEQVVIQAQVEDLARKQTALQEEGAQLTDLETGLHEAQARLQQTQGERKLRQQELAALQGEAKHMDKVASDKAVLQKTVAQIREQIDELEEKVEVIGSQREHVAQIKAEMESLITQQPVLYQKAKTLENQLLELRDTGSADACPLCGQALSEAHAQEVIKSLSEEGKAHADLYRANKKRLAALEVELPQVEKTMAQGQRLEAQLQQHKQSLAQAEARLEELARQQAAWAESGQARLVDAAAVLADESELQAQTAEVQTLSAAVAEKRELRQHLQQTQGALSEKRARLAEVQRLIDAWEKEGQAQLSALSATLDEESFAAKERETLATLQKELLAIGYDEAAYQAARKAREAVADAPEKRQLLSQAETTLQSLDTTLDDLARQIVQQEEELAEQRREQAENEAQIALLSEDSAGLADLEKEVFKLREEEIVATRKVGQAEQHVDVLETLRAQRDELQADKQALALRVQRLKVLEASCGRKGVQALLIEQALPEIEDRANDLLERLTGGDMRIRFETQRQKKSSDELMETLDIIIEDRNGQRPYENYSGGEQFRINFAIRLALSQLLTHRTGARLQTLVVDEGFGSQDPLGRQRLIEAINAVQDDFACILVITHIDELREAFPTRIEVQKETGGSQISVF